MQVLFPPGDTSWRNQRPQSPWREFAFVLHQIQRAIEPALPLADVIDDWNEISKSLAEPPRQRQLQLTEYFEY